MVDAESFDEHQRDLAGAFVGTKLTVEELWLRYFALGGDAGKVEIEAYLANLMPLPALQHNILAHAINERLDELGPPRRAPYRPDAAPSQMTRRKQGPGSAEGSQHQGLPEGSQEKE